MTERFELVKSFLVEAAHYLPRAPRGHMCRGVHGHSFTIDIHVQGSLDEEAGWVIDLHEIAKRFEPVHKLLDHRLLNEVPGLENPTSENLARWIWQRLEPSLTGLTEIVVRETATSAVRYSRP